MTPAGQVALRLPQDLLDRVDELVPERHASRSEVIRRAIELYLYRVACEHDAEAYRRSPLTESEVSVSDDRRNWDAIDSW